LPRGYGVLFGDMTNNTSDIGAGGLPPDNRHSFRATGAGASKLPSAS
jgi:hypothetical protein